MKILAMEIEMDGITSEQFRPYLQAEAQHVSKLYQSGIIRELCFRADRSTAILMLECKETAEAQQTLASLPLVQAGLIRFDLIPLVPYPGFARLFEK